MNATAPFKFDLAAYEKDGFTIVPGFLTNEEVAMLRQAATVLEGACGPLVHENPRVRIDKIDGAPRPRKIEPLIDLSPEFKALTQAPKITGIMQSIFNDAPALFEDKLNYKYPRGGAEFALHQDRWYWQNVPARITSVLIYLDEATPENGCLEVYPGFHQKGLFEMDRKTGISEAIFAGTPRQQALGAAGTAIVFDSMTPHLSRENHSNKFRRAIILSYNPKSAGTFYDIGCGLARDAHLKWLSTLPQKLETV